MIAVRAVQSNVSLTMANVSDVLNPSHKTLLRPQPRHIGAALVDAINHQEYLKNNEENFSISPESYVRREFQEDPRQLVDKMATAGIA